MTPANALAKLGTGIAPFSSLFPRVSVGARLVGRDPANVFEFHLDDYLFNNNPGQQFTFEQSGFRNMGD